MVKSRREIIISQQGHVQVCQQPAGLWSPASTVCQQAVVQDLAASQADDGHNFTPRAIQCHSLYNLQDEACKRLPPEQQVFPHEAIIVGGTKVMTA